MGDAELKSDVQQLKAQMETITQSLANLANQGLTNGNSSNNLIRSPTIKFPVFNGDDIEGWLFKCDQFFSVTDVDAIQKVTYVSMHLESKALAWHQAYTKNRTSIVPLGWDEYKVAIFARFGNTHDDPMADLLNLKQTETVHAYHDKFDALISKLNLLPAYALSCFIEGLNDNISVMVKMLKPKTIQDAYGLAKLQETALKLNPKTNRNTSYSSPTHSKPFFPSTVKQFPTKNSPPTKSAPTFTYPSKLKPADSEVEEKRAKGLCFYCDEKYTPLHVCKNRKRQLFSIEQEEQEEEGESDKEEGEKLEPELGEVALISIYALAGQQQCQTMRIPGQVGKKTLSILIDSGSSHNFIDAGVASKLGLNLQTITPFNISVANGGRLACSQMIKGLKWRIRNTDFSADFFALPLGSCDAVLGIQWLETLGPITWDFKLLTMKFNFEGKHHVLKGTQTPVTKVKTLKNMEKTLENGAQLAMLHPIPNSGAEFFAIQATTGEGLQEEVQQLINQFPDVFEEPKGLPPLREGHNHHINLATGAEPVNIRPYRYPMLQKDAIEAMTQELMENGVIRHSTKSIHASSRLFLSRKKMDHGGCVLTIGS
ncbi:uncharacterized protein LOC141612975 [Silene latifolia]|uniref:uncharacterized protein LOC141612975 n=1 Tax=Silene latifolia TaxID=37657 RepID=UPI003D76DA8F